MKKIISTITAILILVSPLKSSADTPVTEIPTLLPPVILTEVQTGAMTAGDEFVELYNTSDAVVDLTGWQVRYVNATTAGSDSTLLASVTSEDPGAPVLVPPHGYYVLHTATISLSATQQGQVYTAKLSNSDKAIGLFAPESQLCQLVVQDAVAWGASLLGESIATERNTSGDKIVRRHRDAAGVYIDTNNNAYDWISGEAIKTVIPSLAANATPGSDNIGAPKTTNPLPGQGAISQLASVSMSGCTLPQEDPELPPPLNPSTDEPPSVTEPPDPPEDDSQPGPSYPARNIGLTSPQLTELLPNPAKPLTDAADEFVELYNANPVAFDLSGFILESGKRRYVFPANTLIGGRSFLAVFSGDTKLSLSNTVGQVRFLDPFGRLLAQSDAYQSAKDGQAWALAGGAWQWTTLPTPNAANVMKAPAIKAKKTTAKNKANQSGTVKGAQLASLKKTDSSEAAASTFADAPSSNPLHPGVLALVGFFAILYGAYEYRSDLANRIYQLRVYRTARREARQTAKRR